MVSDKDLMGGFAKGLKVMTCFAADRQRVTIAEAAGLCGFDRATTRRCLLTLAESGLASYDGKYFTLTPKVLRLGHAWLSAAPLPTILQPHLDELAQKVGQSASASVLDNQEVVYIARAAQTRVMSINLMPGSRLPACSASMGRVLLASLPEKHAREIIEASVLQRYTVNTLTEPAALMKAVAKVRETGFALIDQELELGLCSIAVPVFNRVGQTVAAINIGVSAAVCPASDLASRFLEPLQETQYRLREVLPA